MHFVDLETNQDLHAFMEENSLQIFSCYFETPHENNNKKH